MYCRVDEVMGAEPKHPQAKRYPSEVVTLALLYALKGAGERACCRRLRRDYAALLPALPERTRTFRLFATHRARAERILVAPSVLGIADSDGVELRHPRCHGRAAPQLGGKGPSNHRWIAGGKLGVPVNQWGRVVAWADATANGHDSAFHPLIARFEGQTNVLTNGNVHRKGDDPADTMFCARGTWPQRVLVETVLSLLTRVCHARHAGHRLWAACRAHIAIAESRL